MIELACPESCQYLHAARERAGEREGELRAKVFEAKGGLHPEMNERLLAVTFAIEGAIINTQRGTGGPAFSDLEDSEVLAALENTIKNVETESSGLIYEHRATSPRVQELGRSIRAALDDMARQITDEERLQRKEMIKALDHVREMVKAHIERAEGNVAEARSFIRHIALFFPWPEEATKPLIIQAG